MIKPDLGILCSRSETAKSSWFDIISADPLQIKLENYIHFFQKSGHDINRVIAVCPVGQVRFNIHLLYPNFHLP